MTTEQKTKLIELSQEFTSLCDKMDAVKKEIDDLVINLTDHHFNFDPIQQVAYRIKNLILCEMAMAKLTDEEKKALNL